MKAYYIFMTKSYLCAKVTDDFVVRATSDNKTIITSEIFTNDPAPQIRNLKVGGAYNYVY